MNQTAMIPDEILAPATRKRMRELSLQKPHIKRGVGIDKFVTYDFEKVREWCGPEYAMIPLDDVRNQCTNLRKAGQLGAVSGGHGASKSPEHSEEYRRHMASQEWKAFLKRLKEFWGGKCSICNSSDHLQGHHRTYERLGHEQLTDCILACKKCHKVADVRREREMKKRPEPGLFPA